MFGFRTRRNAKQAHRVAYQGSSLPHEPNIRAGGDSKMSKRTELPPGARRRGARIQVRVYRGYDAAKQRSLYATGTAGSVTEAWKLWAKLTEQVENQTYTPPQRITVAEHCAEWLEKIARPNVKERTYNDYEAIVRLHITPHIGDIFLNRLTPKHVDELMAKLEGIMSESRRLTVFRVLNRALNIAVRWQVVGKNVCQAVDPPAPEDPEMYIMTVDEVHRMLSAAKGDRLYPFYLTAVYTGMRLGELLGLRWSDIDLEGGLAWVRQTLRRSGLDPVFDTPKNNRTRSVPLDDAVIGALRSHRIDQEVERSHYGHEYRDYGLVFCQPTGAPIDTSSLHKWHWTRLKKTAGLPQEVRIHDLRHTFVSRALAAGANIRAISDIVGHHDPSFTLRRYAHTHTGDRAEAIRQLGSHLSPSDTNKR